MSYRFQDAQPGLEVVGHGVYPDPHFQEKENVPVTYSPRLDPWYSAPEHPSPDSKDPQISTKRRKLWWIVGGVLLLLAILGAVLGGLFGAGVLGTTSGQENEESRDDPVKDSPDDNSSGNKSAIAYGVAQSIRRGSPLAVTGWKRRDGSTEIFLFHQNDDNKVRYSHFHSGRESTALNDTFWEEPLEINTFALAESRLSATLLIFNGTHEPQVQLYYSGATTRLLGVNINDQNTPASREDTINDQDLTCFDHSSVSAYWPWLTYQDPDGELMEVRNLLGGFYSPSPSSWDIRKLGVRTLRGSRLALVPMSTSFPKMAVEGGYAIIYRDMDGLLAVTVPRLDDDEVADDYARSWPEDFPSSIEVEQDAPISAFSVGRPRDAEGRVDTYILYRDGADISMVYTNGSTAWETSKPEALQGVDSDTDISCITMGTSPYDATRGQLLLGQGVEDARCYFQKEGVVQEVSLEGGNWKLTRVVPVP